MLTVLAFKRGMREGCDRTVTKDAVLYQAFTIGVILRLQGESVQVGKHTCGSKGSSTTVKFMTVPVFLRAFRGK